MFKSIEKCKRATQFSEIEWCYVTIAFGQVTHTLDAAAMWMLSFVYLIHIL